MFRIIEGIVFLLMGRIVSILECFVLMFRRLISRNRYLVSLYFFFIRFLFSYFSRAFTYIFWICFIRFRFVNFVLLVKIDCIFCENKENYCLL